MSGKEGKTNTENSRLIWLVRVRVRLVVGREQTMK